MSRQAVRHDRRRGMIVDVSGLESAMDPSLLERRYRALLRVLPRAYRERWAEDMVGTYLDVRAEAAPDVESWSLGRPAAGDVADVVALAVRLRTQALRGCLDPSAGRLAWGPAVRTLVAAALLAHAVLGLLAIVGALWIAGQIAWLPEVPEERRTWESAALPAGTWPVLEFVAPLAWTVAFVALACGRARAARWWTGVALAPIAVGVYRADSSGLPWTPSAYAMLAIWLLPLAGLVAFHDSVPPLRRDPWLGALLASVVFVHVLLLLTPHQIVFLDDVGLLCLAAVGVGLAHLVGLAVGRGAAHTRGVALLVAYAFVLRTASYALQLRETGNFEVIRTAVYAEIAATLALAVPLGLLAGRARRAGGTRCARPAR